MTEEQIKQNADAYANTLRIGGLSYSPKIIVRVSFEAGVHSLDEEIKELQNELESLRKGFYERGDKLKELMLKNNEFRNPWISVEERLPEKTKGIFSCQVLELEKDKIVYYKDIRGYIHTGFLNAQNHWRDLDRDNAAIYPVTHWMPIPDLHKEK